MSELERQCFEAMQAVIAKAQDEAATQRILDQAAARRQVERQRLLAGIAR